MSTKKKRKRNVHCNIICNSQNIEIIRNHSVTNNETYQGPIIGRFTEWENDSQSLHSNRGRQKILKQINKIITGSNKGHEGKQSDMIEKNY